MVLHQCYCPVVLPGIVNIIFIPSFAIFHHLPWLPTLYRIIRGTEVRKMNYKCIWINQSTQNLPLVQHCCSVALYGLCLLIGIVANPRQLQRMGHHIQSSSSLWRGWSNNDFLPGNCTRNGTPRDSVHYLIPRFSRLSIESSITFWNLQQPNEGLLEYRQDRPEWILVCKIFIISEKFLLSYANHYTNCNITKITNSRFEIFSSKVNFWKFCFRVHKFERK